MTKKTNPLHFTAFGATDFVGRSCFIIQDNDRKIVLDCGIELQPNGDPLVPEGVEKYENDVDGIILSHAHIDHSGYLPRLCQKRGTTPIFLTKPTKDIVSTLWQDSYKINQDLLWEQNAMKRALSMCKTEKYKKRFKITEGIYATFYPAGHILGASVVVIDWDGQLVMYSGDINDYKTPLLNGYELPEEDVDTIIMESTNGTRNVTPRDQVNQELMSSIRSTLKNKGFVLIPAFAIGRSQELLFTLAKENLNVPVYIDGMINQMNKITNRYLNEDYVAPHTLDFCKELDKSPLHSDNFHSISRDLDIPTWKQRKQVYQSKKPAIVVTTSGMMEGGPIHTYLQKLAGSPKNLLAITGYQVEGTTGRKIVDGERWVKLGNRDRHGTWTHLRLSVQRFNYSGHAGINGLETFATSNNAKQVILVHGEKVSQDALRERLKGQNIPQVLNAGQSLRLLT